MSPYSVEPPIILKSHSTTTSGGEKTNGLTPFPPSQIASLTISLAQKEKQTRSKSSKSFILRPITFNRNIKLEQKSSSYLNSNNNDIIRERYLCKLGITRPSPSHKQDINIRPAIKQPHQSILSNRLKKRLKNGSNVVQFNNKITVISVASRLSYSSRIQSRIWSNPLESKLNLLRNTFEFASEGGNWRTVIEESRMVKCAITGEKVHPIHTCMSHNYRMPKGNFILYSKMAANSSHF